MTGFRAPFERSDGSCRVFAGEPATLLLRLLDADGAEQDYSGRRFRFAVFDHLGREQYSVTNETPTTIPVGSDEINVIDLTIPASATFAMLSHQRQEVAFWGALSEIIDDVAVRFFKSPFVVERADDIDTPPSDDAGSGSGLNGYGTLFSITQPGMVFAVSFMGAPGPQGPVGGEGRLARAVSANAALDADDLGLFVDASGGVRTITLGAANVAHGGEVFVRKTDASANEIIVSATFFDGADHVVTLQGPILRFVPDKVNNVWHVTN